MRSDAGTEDTGTFAEVDCMEVEGTDGLNIDCDVVLEDIGLERGPMVWRVCKSPGGADSTVDVDCFDDKFDWCSE
jgi:hypothetical protein